MLLSECLDLVWALVGVGHPVVQELPAVDSSRIEVPPVLALSLGLAVPIQLWDLVPALFPVPAVPTLLWDPVPVLSLF